MSAASDRGFFTRLGDGASRIVQRFLPDAFIFALLLTFATMLLAMVFTDRGPGEVVAHWGRGFWYVLTFSMQASLALMTGWAFADSPPIKRVLRRVADVPKTQTQAIFATAVVGMVFGLFHWGVVLIASAIFAREVGIAMQQKGVDVHYPLLVATAYAGLLPWHQGLSGAAPLLVATPDHFLVDQIGVIPVSQTIFSTANLVIVAGVVLVTVVLMPLMAPDEGEDLITVPEEQLRKAEQPVTDGGAAALNRLREAGWKSALLDSKAVCVSLGVLIWVYLGYLFATNDFMSVFNLNVFISVMFGLGFIFHMTLRSYIDVFRDAIEGASQILIQFQFYGGIMGIMAWSGLATLIAQTAAQYSTETTWYLAAFLSAGTVNFFVPSGGGQWVVTGNVMINAAQGIEGVAIDKTVVAFAMGDQWTNMIQPFWALPVLGIAGLSIRDMMGYVGVLFVFSGIVMGIGALLMGTGVL
ncbi:short-chain fatty acid transporter [Halopelagius longus]|uniref:Short-chain fatty acid transporter n=1 Tax=Halopelagius longus TaxID=1236180 RepID=A0A1H1BUS2_9EURY|nr:TIGR00366 family protein [Halopelagius longus]RDI70933.1 short-chain fatty acid transporter [Halopelagius longus]SDQ55659.1 short-chain fatty acids transporter [Halopelagius longus]